MLNHELQFKLLNREKNSRGRRFLHHTVNYLKEYITENFIDNEPTIL